MTDLEKSMPTDLAKKKLNLDRQNREKYFEKVKILDIFFFNPSFYMVFAYISIFCLCPPYRILTSPCVRFDLRFGALLRYALRIHMFLRSRLRFVCFFTRFGDTF